MALEKIVLDMKNQYERLEEIFRTNDVGMAIAITGTWGVGKTYFWNNFYEKVTKKELENKKKFYYEASKIHYKSVFEFRKYAYISLFGIESLSDLKNAICTKLMQNPYVKLEENKLEFVQLFKNTIAQFKDIKVSQYGVSASAKILESLLFLQVKDAIICFDDFERMSSRLDIKDVMGLANQLKLEKNCQVILILDEDKAEGGNKKEYAEYKEKLIDETIIINSVEPLIRENAKEIDEPLIELMVKFADGLEIHNFRFFQKVIKLYRKFRAGLPQKVADATKETILVRILQGYFITDFGSKFEYGWKDVCYLVEEKRKDWSPIKLKTYDFLHLFHFSFIQMDEWGIEFKKWFEQRDSVDISALHELVTSELISENNQNLKNKLWDIFHRRFNLNVTETDFEFIAELGTECIKIETIYNVAVAYNFVKKYLDDERKAEKFKQDVCKVIESDIGTFISRKQSEIQLWEYDNNIFYEYIDKLAKNYQKNKNLKEILSYYLQHDFFKDEEDEIELKKFSADEWFEYLTIDIYNEKFLLENDKTLVYCLRMLSNISVEDIPIKSKVLEVLNKIGEQSEFKKRYVNDIIENHLN